MLAQFNSLTFNIAFSIQRVHLPMVHLQPQFEAQLRLTTYRAFLLARLCQGTSLHEERTEKLFLLLHDITITTLYSLINRLNISIFETIRWHLKNHCDNNLLPRIEAKSWSNKRIRLMPGILIHNTPDFTSSKLQQVTLNRCTSCLKYSTPRSHFVPPQSLNYWLGQSSKSRTWQYPVNKRRMYNYTSESRFFRRL